MKPYYEHAGRDKRGRFKKGVRTGEIIHHIDGNRQNNSDDNLYLCRDHTHHIQIERQLKETFRELLRSGTVTFIQALGIYACH